MPHRDREEHFWLFWLFMGQYGHFGCSLNVEKCPQNVTSMSKKSEGNVPSMSKRSNQNANKNGKGLRAFLLQMACRLLCLLSTKSLYETIKH